MQLGGRDWSYQSLCARDSVSRTLLCHDTLPHPNQPDIFEDLLFCTKNKARNVKKEVRCCGERNVQVRLGGQLVEYYLLMV